jgi:anti-anti-sigma factor
MGKNPSTAHRARLRRTATIDHPRERTSSELLTLHLGAPSSSEGRHHTNLAVVGELDVMTAPILLGAGAAIASQDATALRLNLVGVRFIDVSGVDALVRLQDTTILMGSLLEIVAWSQAVARVLDLLDLRQAFGEVESEGGDRIASTRARAGWRALRAGPCSGARGLGRHGP